MTPTIPPPIPNELQRQLQKICWASAARDFVADLDVELTPLPVNPVEDPPVAIAARFRTPGILAFQGVVVIDQDDYQWELVAWRASTHHGEHETFFGQAIPFVGPLSFATAATYRVFCQVEHQGGVR